MRSQNTFLLLFAATISTLSACGAPAGDFDPSRISESKVTGAGRQYPVKVGKSKVAELGDPNFCKGVSTGECFTLIIQVPAANLQSSVGLHTLNLANADPGYHAILSRTCNEGLQVSLPNLKKWTRLGKVLKDVKRARCVYQTLESEESELPLLAKNEVGLKVRFVDFGLTGKNDSVEPNGGRLELKKSEMTFSFHDVYAFSSDKDGNFAWRPVIAESGILPWVNYSGVFPSVESSVSFNKDLHISLNYASVIPYATKTLRSVFEGALEGAASSGLSGIAKGLLSKVDETVLNVKTLNLASTALSQGAAVGATSAAVGAAGAATTATGAATAAAATVALPLVVGGIVTATIAVDIFDSLCTKTVKDSSGEEHDEFICHVKSKNEDLRELIAEQFAGGTPLPTETKANFIDGLKYLPLAILNSVSENADPANLEWHFKSFTEK